MTHKAVLLSAFFSLALGVTVPQLSAQSAAASLWTLPKDTSVRETGPRTYRFTLVYFTASPTGQIIHRKRFTAGYTRGLPDDQVEWHNVTSEDAAGDKDPFAAPQKKTFMEGFRYSEYANSMTPDFFKPFPATAIMERNLIWDTQMFAFFGQKFLDKLTLNQPFRVISNQDVSLPEVGNFRNRNVVLEWVGRSQRNGQECALITYQAFFNPLQLATGGMTMNARSDYWGEIWVSLATRQIEYATLYEEVTGKMKLPNQDAPQPMSVFRIGSFEPLSSGK